MSKNITIVNPSVTLPSTPPLPNQMTLFVQVDGTGSGRISTDTGIYCTRQDCQANPHGGLVCKKEACSSIVDTGSYVTLTPHADSDSVFSSWGGNEDCADGKVFMNSGILCIAFFHRIYSLTVVAQGPGQITGYGSSDPQPLLECGTKCQTAASDGLRVSLQATPSQGMTFSGWSGDCGTSTQNPLPVEVTKDMKCLATFIAPAPVVTPTPVISTSPVTSTTTPVVPTTPVVTPPVTTTPETTPAVVTIPAVTTATTGTVSTTSPTPPVTTATTGAEPTTNPTPAVTTETTGNAPTVTSTPPTITPPPVTTVPLPVVTPTPVAPLHLSS